MATDPPPDDTAAVVDQQALDAACAVLTREMRDYAPLRHMVADALAAAHQVYADADEAAIEELLDQTGFGGMEIDRGVKLHIRHAARIAQAMVEAFDDLLDTRGAQNYLEWSTTITDPATRLALEAGLPNDQIPPHRYYKVIIVRPGKPTPHELRQQAEARIAAAVQLSRLQVLVDPYRLRELLGAGDECTCKPDELTLECPRHDAVGLSVAQLRQLLALGRESSQLDTSRWGHVLDGVDDPDWTINDGLILNILDGLTDQIREQALQLMPPTPGEH